MTTDLLLLTNKVNVSANHCLTILLGTQCLSGSLHEKDTNEVTAVFSQDFHPSIGVVDQLREIISALKLDANPELQVVATSKNYQLIPQSLFVMEAIDQYLDLSENRSEIEPHYHTIAHQDLYVVYGIDTYLKKALGQQFLVSKWTHISKVLLEQFQQHPSSSLEILFAHLEKGQLFIYVFNQGKIKFYNQFEIASPSDFLYYLLGTCESQSIQNTSIKIMLSGDFKLDDEYHVMAYNYFEKVQLFGNSTHLKGALGDSDTHRFALISSPNL